MRLFNFLELAFLLVAAIGVVVFTGCGTGLKTHPVAGKIEIPSGQAVDIHLTPMAAGSYSIVCTHFLHQSFGMRGTALIE